MWYDDDDDSKDNYVMKHNKAKQSKWKVMENATKWIQNVDNTINAYQFIIISKTEKIDGFLSK